MTFRLDEDRTFICKRCKSSRCRLQRFLDMSRALDMEPAGMKMKRGKRRRTITKWMNLAHEECERERRERINDHPFQIWDQVRVTGGMCTGVVGTIGAFPDVGIALVRIRDKTNDIRVDVLNLEHLEVGF